MNPLLEVENLTVDFWNQNRWVNVVSHVSFKVMPGEAMGLVGESGCGKTTTAYTLLGYRRPNSRIDKNAEVCFDGQNILKLPGSALRRIRGKRIALVPQNPTTTLSPGMRVGRQINEVLAAHGVSGGERQERVLDLLAHVRLPDPLKTAQKYPHQLSGGQQQRVIIAMALACRPDLLVLDEPTTGLDVTTQAQILELLMHLRQEQGMAMVYVTHDLSVVATICDRVGVMYAGELVEEAPTGELFRNPRHPYTRGLIASVPSVRVPRQRRRILLRGYLQRDQLPPGCRFAPRCLFAHESCFSDKQNLVTAAESHQVACWRWSEVPQLATEIVEELPQPEIVSAPKGAPLLQVDDLNCAYEYHRASLFANPVAKLVVRDVSFDIRPSETFALVGESGSGKSTIARTIAGLLRPPSGKVTFDDQAIAGKVGARTQDLRRDIQLVLQNPDASLNPRQPVLQIIGRPLEIFFHLRGKELRSRVEQLLDDVRLDKTYVRRYPGELSGGERQRVAIARALAANPKLMLCDEILSALDVSVQASILELLRVLQAERQIAYLFISHDLAVVRSLAHRVGVLYLGELCEFGQVEEVYSPPFHPYTHMLLSAVPEVNTESRLVPTVRSDAAEGTGSRKTACPFANRCPWKVGKICEDVPPPLQQVSETHALHCHIPLEELRQRETWSKSTLQTAKS